MTHINSEELDERLDPQNELEEILSKMAFKCAGGITHSGRKEYTPAKLRIEALLKQAELHGRIDERNEVALDNYRGHTFSDNTNYEAKFAKFIANNEKRIQGLEELKSMKGEG